ncbi:MAG: hypothetical protein E7014_02165 [Alphaproteobacteria bacterium]|nr:hypothetical protein [Alphaproteobacteria bacterium]
MGIRNSVFAWIFNKIVFLENHYINFEYKIVSYTLIVLTISVIVFLITLIGYNNIKKVVRKKRNCTKCAFCMHCKEYYERPNIIGNGNYYTDKKNLTDKEIQLLGKGDLSFFGKEQREKDAYIEEYNKKLKEKEERIEKQTSFMKVNDVFKKAVMQNSLKKETIWNKFPLKEEFGMGECPEAPEEEWLCCQKEEWGIDDKDFWPELKNHICSDYYPLSKKGRKSIKRCEEIIQAKKSNQNQKVKIFFSTVFRCLKGK